MNLASPDAMTTMPSGDLLRQSESTQRNLGRQGRLVLRRAGEAGQHAGVHRPRRDGIHANARLGDLERHRLGDAFDGVLGADVDRRPRRSLAPVSRGGIDDAAAAWACMARTSCFILRTTPRTLVSNVAAKLSAVWSVIGPTAPSVAALFTATSRRPNRATVLSTIARTSSSLRTSALMNSASEPNERSSLTSAWPASSRRPATTTFAPFLAKATAAARPMPVKAPVINTTGLLICHPRNLLPYRQSMEPDLWPRLLKTETSLRCFR